MTTVNTIGYHNISLKFDVVCSEWSDASKFIICPCNDGSCGAITNYKSSSLSQWNGSDEIHSVHWFPDDDSRLSDNQSVSVCLKAKASKNPQDVVIYLDNIQWIGSVLPTDEPTMNPTRNPTMLPTVTPTVYPTTNPTDIPTVSPSDDPTMNPTNIPTTNPTTNPTVNPMTLSIIGMDGHVALTPSTTEPLSNNGESASPILLTTSDDDPDVILIAIIGALSGILVVGSIGCIVAWCWYRKYVMKSMMQSNNINTPTGKAPVEAAAGQNGVIIESMSYVEGMDSVQIETPQMPQDGLSLTECEGTDSPGAIPGIDRRQTVGLEGSQMQMDLAQIECYSTPTGPPQLENDQRVSQIQI